MKILALIFAYMIYVASCFSEVKRQNGPLSLVCFSSIETSILTSADIEVGVGQTLLDFTQCILNGTIGQCQYQCVIDYSQFNGDELQFFEQQFQTCWNLCASELSITNFANQECYSTGIDIISNIQPLSLNATQNIENNFCNDLLNLLKGYGYPFPTIC
ncbi:19428_t:CDS:2 [Dentiscutata erythropus]|uniref:19428_t:CDS:1 n=1 Tax=Dentiscutata erythropus TaxID=1348616 RepID=A0A9N9H5B1_9GLOM|nr:19428_t:CDS:2 [Dentiscutata erythropus]